MSLEGIFKVESISVGGELVPLLEGSAMTLEVEGDRVTGSAGINRYMGPWDEERLFGLLATTLMGGPPELMSQEQIYLGHLEAADSYETEDDEIRFVADGLVIVTMRRAGTDDASKTS